MPSVTRKTLERPEWADEAREAAGEDVWRFLKLKFGPIDVHPLVEARVRGIDSKRVAAVWHSAEKRLGSRPGLLKLIEQRMAELDEIGERPDRLTYLEVEDVQDDEVDEDEVFAHVDCDSIVERRSWMAFYCPECQQLVSRHRVEEVDPEDVEQREEVAA